MDQDRVSIRRRVGFTIVETPIIDDLSLGKNALLAYLALGRYADNESGQTYTGMRRLAELARLDTKTLKIGIDELVAAGYVVKEKRDKQKSNLYTIGVGATPTRVGMADTRVGAIPTDLDSSLDFETKKEEGEDAPPSQVSSDEEKNDEGRDNHTFAQRACAIVASIGEHPGEWIGRHGAQLKSLVGRYSESELLSGLQKCADSPDGKVTWFCSRVKEWCGAPKVRTIARPSVEQKPPDTRYVDTLTAVRMLREWRAEHPGAAAG